ncbi:MAG: hypothetical protein A2V81_02500 [Candidatus Abawacabacteria bacterium RBG_16_42_10]|uniref:Lipoprotein n=1 Tax=Candidatus Abawacabacteria bacterium RBG_16_42_10 TaxID=1817814 RepID=A0A1F4XKY3_9BACT|nr:MAG: hypothetical protein A2V81_02500 [Candidatus Abawacabacteria bacterium RBG_16_42_10]
MLRFSKILFITLLSIVVIACGGTEQSATQNYQPQAATLPNSFPNNFPQLPGSVFERATPYSIDQGSGFDGSLFIAKSAQDIWDFYSTLDRQGWTISEKQETPLHKITVSREGLSITLTFGIVSGGSVVQFRTFRATGQ